MYGLPAFDPFIRDDLQGEKVFRYADPLADVIVNAAAQGKTPLYRDFSWKGLI